MKKLILLSILLIVGCEETLEPEDCAGVAGGTNICGCNDTTALNYNADATFNDGSCEFDTSTPTVVITYPVNESTLDSMATIKADVVDNNDIISVLFLIDGTEAYADSTAPYEYEWDVCVIGTGNHTVLVKAEDSVGNKGQSDLLTFTIDASYDCENVCGGDKEYDCQNICDGDGKADNCGVCDADIDNDCTIAYYECTNSNLLMTLAIQPVTLFSLFDWGNTDGTESFKLSITNLSNVYNIDYYFYYYGKLNNETVVYGETYSKTYAPGQERVFSNTNFDPYFIKEYFTDNSLMYSLNTIGHLISGNYEIGIELRNQIHGEEESICTVTLDSLYQTP